MIFDDLLGLLGDPDSREKVANALRLLVDRVDVLPIHTGGSTDG